jgi:hypothetical protein
MESEVRAMTATKIQTEPIVEASLSPYKGSWVAIRDGKVVADALDPIELREKSDVREDDFFVLVPSDLDTALLL